MPAQISCLVTKALIPWIERELGPEGVATILEISGRSREYLLAEYNRIPLELADRLVHQCMAMMGEFDEERWAERYAEAFMDWKPSREERGWGGAYTMSLGSPRAIYERFGNLQAGFGVHERCELLSIARRRAAMKLTPPPAPLPRWLCVLIRVNFERFPTNWGLPRARVSELTCAGRGDEACVFDVRWTNPRLGARFWGPLAAGTTGSAILGSVLLAGSPLAGAAAAAIAGLPLLLGGALGYGLLKEHRRRHVQRMLDVLGDEVLYSTGQLERKFRDLEGKIEQLSLLMDLARAVNASLDARTIYEQALQRLVHSMGYQTVYLCLIDHERQVLRGHRAVGAAPDRERDFTGHEIPLDPDVSGLARAAVTGTPVLVNDVTTATAPVHRETAETFNVRSFLAVPLRVKQGVGGVLAVAAGEPDRFAQADVDLMLAVADQVATAIDKAQSFRTIEELSRGLEEKVRVRTEQLRTANEEVAAAYRELQAAQVQLVQREKMASVGQLVAGVAHELNNPIGFVASNAATLEDFVGRLRAMLESYRTRGEALPEADRRSLGEEWQARKVDYALRYLDSMILGIREGAERTRKIVRDLRVFARGDDDVRQPVDLHEELESSLTLLGHLLKDRVVVERKYGDLPAVECVRSQIDQVLLNILANAAQAIEGPGSITIETRREDGRAVVAVRDSGPGIAPEAIGRVFDPFFTTKPVGEGSGLGLSISYEIVKKHGGAIGVDSRPGEGATFTVTLPIAGARPAAEPPWPARSGGR
jgi:signal transduction histidine kinase